MATIIMDYKQGYTGLRLACTCTDWPFSVGTPLPVVRKSLEKTPITFVVTYHNSKSKKQLEQLCPY